MFLKECVIILKQHHSLAALADAALYNSTCIYRKEREIVKIVVSQSQISEPSSCPKMSNLASRHLSRHLNQPYNQNIVSRHLSRHLQHWVYLVGI